MISTERVNSMYNSQLCVKNGISTDQGYLVFITARLSVTVKMALYLLIFDMNKHFTRKIKNKIEPCINEVVIIN